MTGITTWWLIPRIVSELVHPNYKWIKPTYPIYNWGYNMLSYNPLTKWDEPPSIPFFFQNHLQAMAHTFRHSLRFFFFVAV